MKTQYKLFAFFIAVVLFATSCGDKKASDTQISEDEISADTAKTEENVVQFSQEQFQSTGIELGKVQNVKISGAIKVSGALDVPPESLALVSAPLGGFLKSTNLLQGTYVNKGQVVAVMQDQSYVQLQQDYLESKSQMEFLETEYQRQQELAKENVNAQKTLQQAKSDFQSISAKVNGLKKKLELINVPFTSLEKGDIHSTINIYAPTSGYVTKILVSIGAYVNPSDQMFEIVDTKHLHAELEVFEQDVPKLKVGQQIRFTLGNESKERMATIHLIGREISAERTVRVHCHLVKEDSQLLPGTFLKAIVEIGSTETPALPDQAIANFEGKQYIMVCTSRPNADSTNASKNDSGEFTFEMVEIQTGVSESGYTAVILPENFDTKTANIVVKGTYDILSKMKNSEEEE